MSTKSIILATTIDLSGSLMHEIASALDSDSKNAARFDLGLHSAVPERLFRVFSPPGEAEPVMKLTLTFTKNQAKKMLPFFHQIHVQKTRAHAL